MYRFDVNVYARPEVSSAGDAVELRGVRVAPLEEAGAALRQPFELSFEQAAERLEGLERMFCEPDGSFVWVGQEGERRWQVDGHLYDRDERLLYVYLKGDCPAAAFDQLLSALGWPRTPLVFQLAQEAWLLDEPDFRRYAVEAKVS